MNRVKCLKCNGSNQQMITLFVYHGIIYIFGMHSKKQNKKKGPWCMMAQKKKKNMVGPNYIFLFRHFLVVIINLDVTLYCNCESFQNQRHKILPKHPRTAATNEW